MEINSTCYSGINFGGIKLSKYDPKLTKRVIKYLELNGYECADKKTYMANNTLNDKQRMVKIFKQNTGMEPFEFGVVEFPWSKETYILSSKPPLEQKLLEWVREMDSGACVNLLI